MLVILVVISFGRIWSLTIVLSHLPEHTRRYYGYYGTIYYGTIVRTVPTIGREASSHFSHNSWLASSGSRKLTELFERSTKSKNKNTGLRLYFFRQYYNFSIRFGWFIFCFGVTAPAPTVFRNSLSKLTPLPVSVGPNPWSLGAVLASPYYNLLKKKKHKMRVSFLPHLLVCVMCLNHQSNAQNIFNQSGGGDTPNANQTVDPTGTPFLWTLPIY